jgi:hypothetical protein
MLNPSLNRPFGKDLPQCRCRSAISTVADLVLQTLLRRGDRDEGFADRVVDDLATETLKRSINAQPGPLGGSAHPLSHSEGAPLALTIDNFANVHNEYL